MLPGVRKFLFCGEILPPDVAGNLLERFPGAEVWNTYGPTEATCATTSLQITKNILKTYHPLPVGHPKPGSLLRVLKPDGTMADEDERGEIIIAGPNVSPGYLGKPELTARAFFRLEGQRAYHTGDRGYFHKGMLFFEGRQDHQIKLHGYRIELGDIEVHLMQLALVQDAVVIPRMQDGDPDSLCAFIIPQERGNLDDFELSRLLKKELGQRLPAYMVPRIFYFLDKFPLTHNGKVDRRGLAKRLK
jgi:D-alanine--poly(phosphoribitol) ligase subunit 1